MSGVRKCGACYLLYRSNFVRTNIARRRIFSAEPRKSYFPHPRKQCFRGYLRKPLISNDSDPVLLYDLRARFQPANAGISAPGGGEHGPQTAGPAAPGPRGCAPRLFRFAPGGSPLLLPSREAAGYRGKRVCKTMGEAPAVGAKRKPRVSRWATCSQVVHGHPEGARGGAKAPAQVFGFRGASPASLGVEDPRPPQGLTSLRQQGIVSTPFP